MRELKFRAWHKVNECMVDWKFLCSVRYGGNKLNNRKEHDSIFSDPDYILQPYIGYSDMNGVEIHEGDIVEDVYDSNGWRSPIEWFALRFDFLKPHPEDKSLWDFMYNSPERLKVIGNIHENPELLF